MRFLQRNLIALATTAGMLALCTTQAHANYVTSASATLTCSTYNVTFGTADLAKGHTYSLDYVLDISPGATGFPITGSSNFKATSATQTASATGSFSSLNGDYSFSGTATLVDDTTGTTHNTIAVTFTPSSLTCPITITSCPGANSSLITKLGAAGPNNFAVLSLGGTGAKININLATITGALGAPNYTGVAESAPSVIDGDVILGSSVSPGGLRGSHGAITHDDVLLAQAVSDAETAATYFAGLSPTSVQSHFPANGQISGNLVVTGGVGLNVVDLPAFTLNNAVLTLQGPAGAAFVFNISGNFNMHTGRIQVAGGLGPLDVVYNIVNPAATVTTMVPTTGVGILLAPHNNINTMDSSAFSGEMIGGFEKTIILMSGSKFTNPCQKNSSGGA
jgi:hypothetical protein